MGSVTVTAMSDKYPRNRIPCKSTRSSYRVRLPRFPTRCRQTQQFRPLNRGIANLWGASHIIVPLQSALSTDEKDPLTSHHPLACNLANLQIPQILIQTTSNQELGTHPTSEIDLEYDPVYVTIEPSSVPPIGIRVGPFLQLVSAMPGSSSQLPNRWQPNDRQEAWSHYGFPLHFAPRITSFRSSNCSSDAHSTRCGKDDRVSHGGLSACHEIS